MCAVRRRVDQNIYPTKLLNRSLSERIYLVSSSNFISTGRDSLPFRFYTFSYFTEFGLIFWKLVQKKIGTLSGIAQRNRTPKLRTSPSYQRNFVLQFH